MSSGKRLGHRHAFCRLRRSTRSWAGRPRTITRDAQGHPTLRALRLGEAIAVDGRLSERFYTTTSPFDDLIQAVPASRGVPSERTEVWIGFDDANRRRRPRVGFARGGGVDCRRDAPGLESTPLERLFGIYLDTYRDRRNAVGFFVTPIGGYAEVQITNGRPPTSTGTRSPGCGHRSVRRRLDGGDGHSVQVAALSPGRRADLGIQIRRSVLRSNEWSYLTASTDQVAGAGPNGVFRVSMCRDLVGIEAPSTGLNLEVKPFVTSRVNTDRVVAPPVENDWLADAGVDVKCAVTQNLALDVTVNTDLLRSR